MHAGGFGESSLLFPMIIGKKPDSRAGEKSSLPRVDLAPARPEKAEFAGLVLLGHVGGPRVFLNDHRRNPVWL